jgi:TnpA family transposase
MASVDRTAYPRIGKHLSASELNAQYAIDDEETRLVRVSTNGDCQRLTFLVMLKSRQHLGYFPALLDVPDQIVGFLADSFGIPQTTPLLDADIKKKTLSRYRTVIRSHLGADTYSDAGERLVDQAIRKAALTMSDPADLINVAIETLMQSNIELPAYSTLDRLVGHLRHQVHECLYRSVAAGLDEAQRHRLDAMLEVPPGENVSDIARLKEAPGPATPKQVRLWTDRMAELDAILDPKPLLTGLTHTKIRQFAAEATRLQLSDLRDLSQPGKRYTMILCLLSQAQATTRDELVEMFLRRMRKTRHAAQGQLRNLQEKHREMEEALIGVLGQVVLQAKDDLTDDILGHRVRQILEAQGGADTLGANVEAVSAYHQNNYLPLLWRTHAAHRSLLFRMLELLGIESATRDTALVDAWRFLLRHRNSRRTCLPLRIDLSFMSQRWLAFVRNNDRDAPSLDRRALEVCIFSHVAHALQSGDLYVPGSGAYDDYRTQLLPWERCKERLGHYCRSVGLPTSGGDLVSTLRQRLTELAAEVDDGFPENSEFTIDPDGAPHLKRQKTKPLPANLNAFEDAIRSRLPTRHLLDVLKHVHHWVPYTRHFGPPSGSDPKLKDAVRRYLFTVFGFGCNLGASQTARHAPQSINRQTLQRINAQHIDAGKLEAAVADVVGEYMRFELPRHWGAANVAIADGTQMELRENNLLGERHIRYGGYGGIAYHHISATYIALFSKFIACGVWEAVYILDALMENRSELQPDTVHADTQGQSEPVFGLAHLLGIKLFPRMRNWNDVTFYRPDKDTTYRHIDALFTKSIDWSLIETHWHDMMQVVLSIQAGKILPSTLLRKLGSHSRQSLLNKAFRELGRVERTLFLLRYVSEVEFRHSIREETTKVESYNDFLDWIGFGGPILKSGDPDEQAKQVKYMDLVANVIMLHNISDLTDVLTGMADEGWQLTKELLGRLSPYIREHLRRFGQFVLDMEDLPPPLAPKLLGIST